MRILIAGGSGFIGRAMTHAWTDHHTVRVLTRNPERARKRLPEGVEPIAWDGATLGDWAQALAESEVLVNLSGESVAQRWTPAVKERLRQSRVVPTRLLVDALRQVSTRPHTLLQASAIGIYDQDPASTATEDSPLGTGFLAELGQAWEESARPATQLGVRVCWLRIGVVLGEGGGALERMLTPFKLGAGGPIGSGKQWLSWVHLEDVVSASEFLMERSELAGAFNLTAPNPVTMDEFARTLGRILLRPTLFRVPTFALKLAMGEAAEMLLQGSRVLPKRLLEAGYQFRYPTLEEALRTVLRA